MELRAVAPGGPSPADWPSGCENWNRSVGEASYPGLARGDGEHPGADERGATVLWRPACSGPSRSRVAGVSVSARGLSWVIPAPVGVKFRPEFRPRGRERVVAAGPRTISSRRDLCDRNWSGRGRDRTAAGGGAAAASSPRNSGSPGPARVETRAAWRRSCPTDVGYGCRLWLDPLERAGGSDRFRSRLGPRAS